MSAENMNRGFEFVVGLVAIVLSAVVMDLSRSQLKFNGVCPQPKESMWQHRIILPSFKSP